MITPLGGLAITLEPKDVTWFRFLQLSRSTNSLNGGWNSKSHWRDGLSSLSRGNAKFIEEWTKNSLANDNPEPRKKDFMFDRDPSKEREALNRGPLTRKDDLSKLRESELNTRLFQNAAHGLWGQTIGYEIPLSAESEGQLKVDILAIGNDKHSIEIGELKQASNHSDSPLMALTEAICYGIQAIRCRKCLLNDSVLKEKSISAEYFRTIRLILAAPQAYWDYWGWNSDLVRPTGNIVLSVNKGLAQENATLLFDERSICRLDQALPPLEIG